MSNIIFLYQVNGKARRSTLYKLQQLNHDTPTSLNQKRKRKKVTDAETTKSESGPDTTVEDAEREELEEELSPSQRR